MSDKKTDLDHPWKQVQTAVWLIGLAILAWQDWWWPGILVLVAISGLTEAAMRQYETQQEQEATTQQSEADAMAMRVALTPADCPKCGSPITAETVEWTGPITATCPYCGSVVTKREQAQAGNGES